MSALTMTPRKRMQMALAHQEADCVPIHDSPWAATITRWRGEGMPDFVPCDEYFGYHLRGFGADTSPMYPVRVLERTPEYIVETTNTGGVRRNHRDYSTTPELVDYGVKSREDWEAARRRMRPSVTRVDWVALKYGYDRARADDLFVTY
ncbi:MAG: hypothetical protein QME94_09785, partial [Anaerolineae bacterium]|nr:hypothetical protein [Anaerolineae bacterium]